MDRRQIWIVIASLVISIIMVLVALQMGYGVHISGILSGGAIMTGGLVTTILLALKLLPDKPLVFVGILPLKILSWSAVAVALLFWGQVSLIGFSVGAGNVILAVGLEKLFGPREKVENK